ncbi:MAG TPA: ABC transporter substrate-binding protein [Phototrophicaceae bacterium]|jgi:peptide/nickel transport system substrate-binding protein|nr:ABC transporter substrate-binding protein [Phototrophicaceae bacterium]
MFTSCILMVLFALSFSFSSAQGGGDLIVGTNAPVNLDPASGSNDPEIMFNHLIYDYLLDVASDNSIVPNLATEYSISEDGLTYTLKLAEGVTFHDGSAFSSADVVFTYNRLKEVESPALGLLSGGSFEVTAPDASSVVFTLTEPNADFLYGLAGRLTAILKDGTTTPNVLGEGDAIYANFNGTGPFKLSEYSASEDAVFVRNENYFKAGEPKLDSVKIVFIDDPLAQIDALKTGAVNFIFKIPVDQIANLEGVDGITVLEKATNLHPVIRLRSDEGHIGADPRIRTAFKLATNRAELNDVVLEGRGVVGNNDPIGPAYGSFYDDSIAKPEYDPEQACALIKEATGEDRLTIDFYVVDSLGYPDLATVMQQQWQEGCIDANLLVRTENVYYGNNEWMDVDLGLTGWGSRPIPQQYLTEAYISTGIYNESHWSNADLDALVAEASKTSDPDARAALYSQIAQIFADDGPIIIPYFAPMIGAVSANVEGLDMASFPGLTDFRTVTISQ